MRCVYSLANRFVVFPNDIEYLSHMASVHGHSNRVFLNFQVSRSAVAVAEEARRAGMMTADDGFDCWNFDAPTPETSAPTREEAFPALPTPAAPAPPATVVPPPRPVISSRPTPFVVPQRTATRIRAATAGQTTRNQRLANALGVARPGVATGDARSFENEMETPKYHQTLIDWGRNNLTYLKTTVERRLERVVKDASCYNVTLRAMPAEEVCYFPRFVA